MAAPSSQVTIPSYVQRGLRWSAMHQIVSGLTGTLGAVVYTRFLQPEDLGAYGLAALVYSGLFLLVQAPIRDAVVYFQRREQDHSRAAFWLLVGFSGLAAIGVLVCADLFARLYHAPRAASLTRGMAIVFVFQALAVVPAGLLLKRFRFGLHEGLGTITDLMMLAGWIALATLGFGPWSIVIPYLVSSIFWAASTWLGSRFRPWPIPAREAFGAVVRYSRSLFGSKLLVYLSRNLDNAAVGTLGEKAMGLYRFGEIQAEYFGMVVGETVAQIALPAMAAVQDQLEKLRQIYLDLLQLTAALSFPILVGGMTLADLGIRVFLGEKWMGAAPVFRAYMVMWLLRTLLYLGDSLTSATGRPQVRLAFDVILLPFFAAGTWFGLRVWGGIAGVAWTLVMVQMAVGAAYWLAVLRILRLGPRIVLPRILPGALAATVMGASVYFGNSLLPLEDFARLAILAVMGMGIFLTAFYVLDAPGFRSVRGMIRDILAFGKGMPGKGQVTENKARTSFLARTKRVMHNTRATAGIKAHRPFRTSRFGYFRRFHSRTSNGPKNEDEDV